MLFRTLMAALLGAAISFTATADDAPRMAIIIDDLGDRLPEGRRAVRLPGALTYAFLPHTPHSRPLARLAHNLGKEVMLHLPMDSVNRDRLGPGGLTLDMTHEKFRRTLLDDLKSVPHVRGVNNHMGSLLTRHPGHMGWLMAELAASGDLYFVDSRTARRSVAVLLAEEYGVSATRRDIFLDNVRDQDAIMGQFQKAVTFAGKTGAAIAIGHPYPETIGALQKLLPQLKAQGIRLVPVSKLIHRRNERSIEQWQASLYPSQRAAKNSKP
ncbi:divergent polysaccharide deacetylase family protein [Thiohalomonas denitrificans]|uniref:divergent polysaccharide deacetylase family protein n=1 Tax=Thiohalomonas denitrificans TaxID=415747 RepID=UPI0026EAE014|nr:divergent polysaccharide deacetylase family protein [Thiohalomonas denitrificans]